MYFLKNFIDKPLVFGGKKAISAQNMVTDTCQIIQVPFLHNLKVDD